MFEIGEIVCLQSGGPHMTILEKGTSRNGDESRLCTWFPLSRSKKVQTGQILERWFPVVALERAE